MRNGSVLALKGGNEIVLLFLAETGSSEYFAPDPRCSGGDCMLDTGADYLSVRVLSRHSLAAEGSRAPGSWNWLPRRCLRCPSIQVMLKIRPIVMVQPDGPVADRTVGALMLFPQMSVLSVYLLGLLFSEPGAASKVQRGAGLDCGLLIREKDFEMLQSVMNLVEGGPNCYGALELGCGISQALLIDLAEYAWCCWHDQSNFRLTIVELEVHRMQWQSPFFEPCPVTPLQALHSHSQVSWRSRHSRPMAESAQVFSLPVLRSVHSPAQSRLLHHLLHLYLRHHYSPDLPSHS